MLRPDFLSFPFVFMNTSLVCFLNISYSIYLPVLFSQRLLQSLANLRITGLEESLPRELIAVLNTHRCTSEVRAEVCCMTEVTKSLSRFPGITISLKNAFIPHSCSSSLLYLVLFRLIQLKLSQDHPKSPKTRHRTDSYIRLWYVLFFVKLCKLYNENYLKMDTLLLFTSRNCFHINWAL